MKHVVWILVLLVFALGCQSQSTPTAAPTSAPAVPTDTPQPTATRVLPTATILPTQVPPTPTFTPTPVPVTASVKSDVNVRELPDTKSKALGVLKKGAQITLAGRNADSTWFFIPFPETTSDTRGWVLGSGLTTTSLTQTLSVVSPVTPTVSATRSVTPTTPAATAVTTPAAPVTGTAAATAVVTGTAAARPTVQATAVISGSAGNPSGTIIYDVFLGNRWEVRSVKADGSGMVTLFTSGSEPALSPAGGQMAWHAQSGADCANLVISAANGSNCFRLSKESTAGYPSWSPDGKNLAFHLLPSGDQASKIVIACATCGPDQDNTFITFGKRPAWQPGGGQLIAYDGCKPDGSGCNSVYRIGAFGEPKTPLLVSHGSNAAWSPNGSRIAFQDGDGKGSIQIFVSNVDGANRTQVTNNTGNNGDPIWSADGQWIFYRSDQAGQGWVIKAIRADGRGDRVVIDATVNAGQWDFEKLAISR